MLSAEALVGLSACAATNRRLTAVTLARAPVIADLHCHYPMHVVMHEPRHRIEHLLRMRGRLRSDQIRVLVLRAASALITGSHEYVALETDFDGFIKSTMGGLETPADLRRLDTGLAEHYGDDSALITSGNALRVLRELWRP